MLSPRRWQLRRLRDHVVIAGSGRLTRGYLQLLRKHHPDVGVVVVTEEVDELQQQELAQTFGATVIRGDITQEFLLRQLRLLKARKILLFGDDDFQTFEAASRIVALRPSVASRIVLHCHNLRFLRSMQQTALVRQFESFNAYHLAATGLVKDHLLNHFHRTDMRDVVVLAGFGRFGQTILEEINAHAAGEVAVVAIIDGDAQRRMLVVEEQQRVDGDYRRIVVEGDIADPKVWQQLADSVDLGQGEPVIVLGTGHTEQNLRSAIWLKERFPSASVHVRTNGKSRFAQEMGAEHGIYDISISQLVEDYLPREWLG